MPTDLGPDAQDDQQASGQPGSPNLGEGNSRDEGSEWGATHPPPEHLWVRAQANCNIGGHRLERDTLYLVDPQDPFIVGLIERDHPWLIPLPGQGWGDRITS